MARGELKLVLVKMDTTIVVGDEAEEIKKRLADKARSMGKSWYDWSDTDVVVASGENLLVAETILGRELVKAYVYKSEMNRYHLVQRPNGTLGFVKGVSAAKCAGDVIGRVPREEDTEYFKKAEAEADRKHEIRKVAEHRARHSLKRMVGLAQKAGLLTVDYTGDEETDKEIDNHLDKMLKYGINSGL